MIKYFAASIITFMDFYFSRNSQVTPITSFLCDHSLYDQLHFLITRYISELLQFRAAPKLSNPRNIRATLNELSTIELGGYRMTSGLGSATILLLHGSLAPCNIIRSTCRHPSVERAAPIRGFFPRPPLVILLPTSTHLRIRVVCPRECPCSLALCVPKNSVPLRTLLDVYS